MTKAAGRDPYITRLADLLGGDDARARAKRMVDDIEREWERWAPLANAHDVALMLGIGKADEHEVYSALVLARILLVEEGAEQLLLHEPFLAYLAERRVIRERESTARYERAQRMKGGSGADQGRIAPGSGAEMGRSAGGYPDPSGADHGQQPGGSHVGTKTRAHTGATRPRGESTTTPTTPHSLHPRDLNTWLYNTAVLYGWPRRNTISPSLRAEIYEYLMDREIPGELVYESFRESDGASNRVNAFRAGMRRRVEEWEYEGSEFRVPSSEEDGDGDEERLAELANGVRSLDGAAEPAGAGDGVRRDVRDARPRDFGGWHGAASSPGVPATQEVERMVIVSGLSPPGAGAGRYEHEEG